jgi:pimeloyl-ACP methyl ester carboxylesterase
MEWMLAAVAVVAVFGVLAAGHHAFWSRRLHQPIRDDGVVRAETRDGWQLALGTRRPRGSERYPAVLLVHGLASNRWALDAGVEGFSLAAHLAAAGFRTFALDLRGHGDSRVGPAGAVPWTFDHYVDEDVPAALDAIRRETGQEQVLWVGHSLGAVLGMVACQTHPNRIAGIVAIAGPMSWEGDGKLAGYLKRGALVDGRFNRMLAQFVAPWAGLAHPPAADLAINGRNVDRPVFRRLLANGIENVSRPLFHQLTGWVTNDVCQSVDGTRDYRAGLAACRQPALFVAASRDRLAPPAVVRASCEAWGGPRTYVEFRRDAGHSADYGHTDLLVGRNAATEVFPVVSAWLEARSTIAGEGSR